MPYKKIVFKHFDKLESCGFCKWLEALHFDGSDHYCNNKNNEGYQVKLWFTCPYFKKNTKIKPISTKQFSLKRLSSVNNKEGV